MSKRLVEIFETIIHFVSPPGMSNSHMVKLLFFFPEFTDFFVYPPEFRDVFVMFSSCFHFSKHVAWSRICFRIGGEVDKGEGLKVLGRVVLQLCAMDLLISKYIWGLVCPGQNFWLRLKSRGKLTSPSPSSRSLTEDRITVLKQPRHF